MRKIYLLFVILFIGCAGMSHRVAADGAAVPPALSSAATAEMDESFDPLTLDDFEFSVSAAKPAVGSDIRTVTPEELLQAVANGASNDADEIEGYRVQLLATRSEEEARAMVRNAVISFSEQVYREFDNPYYKIRVGDFKSRYDAVMLQEKALQMGFSEAWVVRSMVKKKLVASSAAEGAAEQ